MSNKQRQRANHHPLEKMAKTRAGKNTSRGAKSKKAPSGSRAAKFGTKNVTRKLVQDEYESDEEHSHSDSVEEEEPEEEEETTGLTKDQMMLMQLTNLIEQQKGSRSKAPRSRKGKAKSTESALMQLVYDTAKTDLFKVCKFISNDDQLVAAWIRYLTTTRSWT